MQMDHVQSLLQWYLFSFFVTLRMVEDSEAVGNNDPKALVFFCFVVLLFFFRHIVNHGRVCFLSFFWYVIWLLLFVPFASEAFWIDCLSLNLHSKAVKCIEKIKGKKCTHLYLCLYVHEVNHLYNLYVVLAPLCIYLYDLDSIFGACTPAECLIRFYSVALAQV